MNRFIKSCFTIASGFCAIGLVLIIIGGIFGGYRQTVAIALNGGFSYPFYVDALVDGTVAAGTDTKNTINPIELSEGIYENNNICKMDEVVDISIDIRTYELNVCEWEGTTYKVVGKNVPGLKCFVQNGTLYLKGTRKYFKPSLIHEVTLYVPKGAVLEQVDVGLGAGKGTIEDLRMEELDIHVGAGKFNCKNIKTDILAIEAGAGKVDCQDCEAEEARLEIGAGSLSYEGEIKQNIDISCAMGSTQLYLNDHYKDYDYDIEVAAGNLTIDQQNEGLIAFSGLSDKRIDHDANKEMNLNCAMGNIYILFKE